MAFKDTLEVGYKLYYLFIFLYNLIYLKAGEFLQAHV